MKKLLLILGVAIAGSPFVSCKKMKDDIKDLKNQVTDLKKENDTLKGQLNGVEDLIVADPISATTTFQDSTGATRTVSGTYKLKGSDYSSSHIIKNYDGASYDVYIERIGDFNWDNGAYIQFNYNPTTKAVKNVSGQHYWADYDPYWDYARYKPTSASVPNVGLTVSLTVDSLNMTTGATSIKFAASGNGTWTNSSDGYNTPMHGKPVTTNLTFVGKLKLFATN